MEKGTLLLDNSPAISTDYDEDAKILNQQIENENIKNVAIVAKLGAGKSSVIETYLDRFRTKKKIDKNEYKNPEGKLDKKTYKIAKKKLKEHNKKVKKHNYVKLSLSTFNGKDYKEEEIERSILQQLLYSQNKEKLPNSKIERTNRPSFWKTFIFASVLTIFIASSILFGTELSTIKVFEKATWTKYLFLGLMIASFGYILFHCIYYKSFKRIKYKDFELETKNDGDSGSIINKLIDEILYFFECVNIDLVIFEDLDRLPSTDIFVKLRELNTIINNSSNKKCKKITFLYAVKSEVIQDEEQRAKFFDFILSIVPIVNPTTTEEKIREIIDERKSKNKTITLSDEYIKDISLYIPDMRILKNTFNDYFITKNRIVNENNKHRISNEKLFTLSLYRNIFPSEYAKLEKNEGVLPILLNKKILVESITDKLDEENRMYEEKIEHIKNESCQKFNELKYMLNGILLTATPRNGYSCIAVNSITTFKDLDFNNLYHPNYSNYTSYRADISPQIRSVIEEINFYQREQNIKGITENKIEKLLQQIESNKKEKQRINNLTFAELTDCVGLEKIFNNKHIDENKDFNNDDYDKKLLNFLKFIIKNKYVDDKYSEYTHNLSSSIISQGDIEFIKKVQNGTNDFYYGIENVEEVIKRLKREDFKASSAINKTILQNLDKIKDSTKRSNLFKTLTSSSNNSWGYVVDSFTECEDEDISNLVKFLIEDVTICQKVINSNLPERKKYNIINTIVRLDVNIKNYNLDNCLTSYLEEQQNIALLLTNLDLEKIYDIFDSLQPKFLYLTNELCTKEQIDYIVTNNLYKLTFNNLEFLLEFTSEFDNTLFTSDTFDYISSKNDKVSEYINQNMNEFVSNILLNDAIVNSKENSIFAHKLIENANIDIENKIKLIVKFDIEVKDISLIDDELFEKILEFNRMIPSWRNLQCVYNKKDIPEVFLNYIINNLGKIEQIKIDDDNKKFILDLMNSDYFDAHNYKCLANKIDNQLVLSEINSENNKIILIQLGKFDYDSSVFNSLKEFPSALNAYLNCFGVKIEQDFTNFFTTDITTECLNGILLSKDIKNTLKQKLITQFSKKIKIVGFEQEYAELFIINKFKLNNTILFQFTDCNVDKYSLIALTEFDYSDTNATTNIKRLLSSCDNLFEELFNNKKEFKIENTSINNLWIHKIEGFNILKVTRYGKNITLKAV